MFRTNEIRSRLPLKAIIPILLISTLCLVSFATSASISTTPYKAYNGEMISITGDYEVTPVGFSIATDDLTTSTAWSTTTALCTGVIAGNWMYTIQLRALTTTPATVSIRWSANGDPTTYEDMGSITISTNPVNGQQATLIFDTGVTTFNSPVGITITVA